MSQLFRSVFAANMMHKIGLLPFTPGLMADKSQLLPTTIPLSSGSKLFDATLCKRFVACSLPFNCDGCAHEEADTYCACRSPQQVVRWEMMHNGSKLSPSACLVWIWSPLTDRVWVRSHRIIPASTLIHLICDLVIVILHLESPCLFVCVSVFYLIY